MCALFVKETLDGLVGAFDEVPRGRKMGVQDRCDPVVGGFEIRAALAESAIERLGRIVQDVACGDDMVFEQAGHVIARHCHIGAMAFEDLGQLADRVLQQGAHVGKPIRHQRGDLLAERRGLGPATGQQAFELLGGGL